MPRYIHYYKTKSDFNKDYYSDLKYKSPWSSYIKRKSRLDPYQVNYNKNSVIIVPPQGLWVDDFPDGVEDSRGCGEFQTPYDPDFCDCFYGFETFGDYVDDYLNKLQPGGDNNGNYWKYIEDFEFDGVEYFMYELQLQPGNPQYYGLLPKIYSIDQLQQMSMENDCMNRMQPFDYILMEDFEVMYDFPHESPVGYSDSFVLVKVDP